MALHAPLRPHSCDVRADSIEARSSRYIQGLAVRVTPTQIRGYLRQLDCAQELRVRRKNHNSRRPGGVDISRAVDFHPVRHALARNVRCVEKFSTMAQASIGFDVINHPELLRAGTGYVQLLFIR